MAIRSPFIAVAVVMLLVPNDPQPAGTPDSVDRVRRLLLSARGEADLEKGHAQLVLARTSLREFLKANPNDEHVGEGQVLLGDVLNQLGIVATQQTLQAENQEQKARFRAEALDNFEQATSIYQAAHDRYRELYKTYVVFIDPKRTPEEFRARQEAERQYIQSQLKLGLVTMNAAMAYERGTKEYDARLQAAGEQFGAINAKYRSMVVGLYARLYQAKCFHEQGDIRKALGMYNELLGHAGRSPVMKKLQAETVLFKLRCLNSEQRKDYLLVIDLGQEWLKTESPQGESGQGIRLELALAQERRALTAELPEDERISLLRMALENTREVQQTAGPYRASAETMILRINNILGLP